MNKMLVVVCVSLAVLCVIVSPLGPFTSKRMGNIDLSEGARIGLHYKSKTVTVSVNDRSSLVISTQMDGERELDLMAVWKATGDVEVAVIAKADGRLVYYTDSDGDGVFDQKVVRDEVGMRHFKLREAIWDEVTK